jgi:hypothetical protein
MTSCTRWSETTVISEPKQLTVREHAVPAPWQAYTIALPTNPVRGEALRHLRAFVDILDTFLSVDCELQGLTFLQSWRLSAEGTAPLYEANISRWLPSVGLGIFPNRRAPTRMTREAAMDAAAAMFARQPTDLPAYRLMHVSGSGDAPAHASKTLLGQGIVQRLWTRDAWSATKQRGREAYLLRIAEASLRRAAFHIPIFELAAFTSDITAQQVDQWMCGALVYLRESEEDGGLLLLSRQELTPVFKKLELSFASLQNPQFNP